VHVSAGYLSRVFAKEKECSLKEYIIRQKMQMARSLLRTTALPVSIVAARVGYSNFSQFSQTYKQMFDCSPSAERKATEKEKTP
jgi:two-component system response regulator YesN